MTQAELNVRNRKNQHRTQIVRSNGSHKAGIIFLLLVTGMIVAGGIAVVRWMNDAARMPLSRLVITGDRHYTNNDDIRQAILSIGPPGTFMSQDVDVIQRQIERLPWIKQVSVRKQWPDELKIHLVEYTPVARWNGSQMMDASGQSFSSPVTIKGSKELPMLYGPEKSEQEVLAGYHQMRDLLLTSKFIIKTVSMSARRSWQLILDDNIRLELGRTNIAERLKRFIALYPVLIKQAQSRDKGIGSVDLRYDSGAAVGWVSAPADLHESKQRHNKPQAKQ